MHYSTLSLHTIIATSHEPKLSIVSECVPNDAVWYDLGLHGNKQHFAARLSWML